MNLHVHILPLTQPFAARLAEWLLAHLPGAASGDLTGCLVVLPSERACSTLRDALLDASGAPALLLPEIVQLARLGEALAGRLELRRRDGQAAPLPPAHLRPLILAGPLRAVSWVARRPENAAGLARELVDTFDEIRLAGAGRLLERGAPGGAPGGEGDATAGALWNRDLSRLREAWALYRRVIPQDGIDRLLKTVAAVDTGAAPWPGPGYAQVVVAGFSTVSAGEAQLLRALLRRTAGHVFLSEADDAVSRGWLATFHDACAPSHPLAPGRQLRARLLADAAGIVAHDGDGERMNDSAEREPEIALQACADPEAESRVVAGLVCEELQRRRGDLQRGSPVRIAVATGDRALARRIAARLRDSGVPIDDSGGRLLSHLPAGQLACLLLRTAASGVHHRPLLEVLTHPYVRLLPSRSAHARRSLLLEKMVLRGEDPPVGLAEYRRRAVERDKRYQKLHPGSPQALSTFVVEIERGLAPLLACAERAHDWPALLAALREVWQRFAPDVPLATHAADEGCQGLASLLEEIDTVAECLEGLALVDFAAELTRLIAARRVWPHRSAYLPVQITGLLEARLERYDLLLLAGLTDEALPGRQPRPLLLREADRIALGLPTWRDRLGLQGELFLRLLHNGSRVVLTWPREISGQPVLPSPFVERLALSRGVSPREDALRAGLPPEYRRAAVPIETITSAQAAFAHEPPDIRVAGKPALIERVSHSSLRTYLDCPYRFLVERGYGLAEEEEIREEFRKLDYGQVVHHCLQVFLTPDGPGSRALDRGDRDAAVENLHATAAALFAAGAPALPQRRLWESAFSHLAPEIIDAELARRERWVPVNLEARFMLGLDRLAEWLARESARQGRTSARLALSAVEAALRLRGSIDRLEVARDGGPNVAVIDYKTGAVPSARDVAAADDLQLHIYAVAVEAGGVAGLPGGDWRVTEAAYYGLRRGRVGVGKPHYSEQKPGRTALLKGAEVILAAAVSARDTRRPFPLVPHWRTGAARGAPPCRHCYLRGVCRIDERALGPTLRALLAAGERRRTGVAR